MWPNFSVFNYGLTRYLEEVFPIEYSSDPDYLFFSVWSHDHLKYNCEKIFLTHEAAYPDFRWCDYAVTYAPEIETPRHLQLPNFAVTLGYRMMERLRVQHHDVTHNLLDQKKSFAAYLASNGNARPREEIVDALCEYKPVACGGRHRNNIDRVIPPAETLDFLGSAKFVIACENSIAPGYVTEKLPLALLSNSIPIYWGDEFVFKYFNADRFINASSFNTMSELSNYIQTVDQDDDLYMKILREPCFTNDTAHPHLCKQTLLDYFDDVFSGKLKHADKPILSDEEYGQIKGGHRRFLHAPMSPAEASAFRQSQNDHFKRRLHEAHGNEALTGELQRLYDTQKSGAQRHN